MWCLSGSCWQRKVPLQGRGGQPRPEKGKRKGQGAGTRRSGVAGGHEEGPMC